LRDAGNGVGCTEKIALGGGLLRYIFAISLLIFVPGAHDGDQEHGQGTVQEESC
jgi:hypothetical protein